MSTTTTNHIQTQFEAGPRLHTVPSFFSSPSCLLWQSRQGCYFPYDRGRITTTWKSSERDASNKKERKNNNFPDFDTVSTTPYNIYNPFGALMSSLFFLLLLLLLPNKGHLNFNKGSPFSLPRNTGDWNKNLLRLALTYLPVECVCVRLSTVRYKCSSSRGGGKRENKRKKSHGTLYPLLHLSVGYTAPPSPCC